jgi:hypothetical protein
VKNDVNKMRGDKIIIYNDSERSEVRSEVPDDSERSELPDEFQVEVESDQTTVLDYKDPDHNPKTCHEIYLVDKSGSTIQLFQAKRGDEFPCLFISQFVQITKIGNTKLDADKRKEELRLGRGNWKVIFYKGFVITKRDIQNIKTIMEEMRQDNAALLNIKEEGYKDRIQEIKKNCDEKVQLAQEQREQYRQALLNVSKESATAETNTVTNMIEMVGRQARAQRGRFQTGTRTFATKQPENTENIPSSANPTQEQAKTTENVA